MYSNLQYFTNTAYTEMFKMQLRIDVPISRPFIVGITFLGRFSIVSAPRVRFRALQQKEVVWN